MRMNISDARIVEWSISAENGTVKATLVHNITVTGGLCLSFATYSVITGLLSLLMCLSVAMNAAVLATFLIHRRRLITPFTVHVVGLTIFGLIHSIVFFPLVAARPLNPRWMQSNALRCAIFQYVTWMLPMLSFMQDFTICVDRWVAFLAPIWYRRESCVAYGLLGSGAFAFWLHAWYMPLNVLNYYTPLTERNGCDGTLYPKYRTVVYALVCALPQVGVFGSYPFLFFMLASRRRQRNVAWRRSIAVTCSTVTRAALRNTLIFCGRATTTPADMKTEEQAVVTSRSVHVEHVNNMLAATLVSLKLMCAVFGGVPLGLIMEAAVVGRWPPACTWDAFHLSQEMMGLAILAEPFVYLLTLRGLRADFFTLFRRNRLPAGVRQRNRVSVINN